MADCYDTETRHKVMQRIHSKDTRPELRVRSILHRMGFYFRANQRNLPGSPDIVLPRYQTIIMVNGCFWHQHPGCRLAERPKSNLDFWNTKLEKNVERDGRIIRQLRSYGWRVLTIWECQITSKKKAPVFIEAFLVSFGITSPRSRTNVLQLNLFEG